MTRGPSRSLTRNDVFDLMSDRTDEPWTSTELAEELPVSSDTVYNRLRELETQERIRTKKVGGRARIWWVPAERTTSVDTQSATTTQGRIIETMAERTDAGNAWTTSELADQLPQSADSLYHHLRDLDEAGMLESKSVGSRAKVWWIPTTQAVTAE